MFAVQDPCTQAVSLWWAVVAGADGACVSVTMGTIAILVGLFVVAVLVLQYLANRLLFGKRQAASAEPARNPAPQVLAGQVMSSTRRSQA